MGSQVVDEAAQRYVRDTDHQPINLTLDFMCPSLPVNTSQSDATANLGEAWTILTGILDSMNQPNENVSFLEVFRLIIITSNYIAD